MVPLQLHRIVAGVEDEQRCFGAAHGPAKPVPDVHFTQPKAQVGKSVTNRKPLPGVLRRFQFVSQGDGEVLK